jgi:hypothetical protein
MACSGGGACRPKVRGTGAHLDSSDECLRTELTWSDGGYADSLANHPRIPPVVWRAHRVIARCSRTEGHDDDAAADRSSGRSTPGPEADPPVVEVSDRGVTGHPTATKE